jgi:hypothetical protein
MGHGQVSVFAAVNCCAWEVTTAANSMSD